MNQNLCNENQNILDDWSLNHAKTTEARAWEKLTNFMEERIWRIQTLFTPVCDIFISCSTYKPGFVGGSLRKWKSPCCFEYFFVIFSHVGLEQINIADAVKNSIFSIRLRYRGSTTRAWTSRAFFKTSNTFWASFLKGASYKVPTSP